MNQTSDNLRQTIETLIQTAQFDAVIDTCKTALADARNRQDKFTEVIAVIGLAEGHQYIGKFKEARVLIDGAVNFAERLADRELMMAAFIVSAEIFLSTAFQIYEAERDYLQALRIAKELQDKYSIALIYTGLASVALHSDDLKRTQSIAREAFEIARDDNNRYVMAQSLSLIALAVTKDQPEKAMQALEDAMAIAQQDNLSLLELDLTSSIGQLLCRQERYAEEGQLMLEKALSTAKDCHSVPHEFKVMHRLGQAFEQNMSLDRAAQYYSLMLERSQKWRVRSYEGMAFFNLGVLAYNRQHFDDAIANFEQAQAISRETKNPFREARTEQMIGASYFNLESFDKALDHYMAARSIYDSLDNRHMVNTMLKRILMVYVQRFLANVMRWLGMRQNDDNDTTHIE